MSGVTFHYIIEYIAESQKKTNILIDKNLNIDQPWWLSGQNISFAIFKDSHLARTQVPIPFGTMISIALYYENNFMAIQN